jgi:hypothetical protein
MSSNGNPLVSEFAEKILHIKKARSSSADAVLSKAMHSSSKSSEQVSSA